MGKVIECVLCGDEFDTLSPQKKRVGGLISHCISCSEETAVKYAGVQASDGKIAQTTILKFNSNDDRTKYISFWQNVSGLKKPKSCQLSLKATTDPGIKFKTIVAHQASNHKGKQ